LNKLVRLNGSVLDYKSAKISQSVSDWNFRVDFTFSHTTHYLQNERLFFHHGGVIYPVVVDEKGYQDGFVTHSTSLICLGITALLDAPYAEKITLKTWRNTTFFAIVNELCAGVGITPVYQLDDFAIRFYTASKKTPLEIIKELANDVKISLQTSWTGNLIVGYRFKTSATMMHTADFIYPITRVLTEKQAISTTIENKENFDAVQVIPSFFNDDQLTIEQFENGGWTIIKVFMPNWTNTPPDLLGYGVYDIEYLGIKEQVKEISDVQIKQGAANVESGNELVSYKYYGNDLGEITLGLDGDVLTGILENGLATLLVKRNYHCWRAKSDSEKLLFDVFESVGMRNRIIEIRANDGSKYAEPIIVSHTTDSVALQNAGRQFIRENRDYTVVSFKCDHWYQPPMPSDIVSFDGELWYCDDVNISTSIESIYANVTLRKVL